MFEKVKINRWVLNFNFPNKQFIQATRILTDNQTCLNSFSKAEAYVLVFINHNWSYQVEIAKSYGHANKPGLQEFSTYYSLPLINNLLTGATRIILHVQKPYEEFKQIKQLPNYHTDFDLEPYSKSKCCKTVRKSNQKSSSKACFSVLEEDKSWNH